MSTLAAKIEEAYSRGWQDHRDGMPYRPSTACADLSVEQDSVKEALEEIAEHPAGEADDSHAMRSIARRSLKAWEEA